MSAVFSGGARCVCGWSSHSSLQIKGSKIPDRLRSQGERFHSLLLLCLFVLIVYLQKWCLLSVVVMVVIDLCCVSGLWGSPRGGSDDPRRGVRFSWAVWLWCPEHNAAHPEPHPRHASPPPHPTARGDVLPPPKDGRLLPHLLQTECTDTVQGHVSGCIQQLHEEEADGAGGSCFCLDSCEVLTLLPAERKNKSSFTQDYDFHMPQMVIYFICTNIFFCHIWQLLRWSFLWQWNGLAWESTLDRSILVNAVDSFFRPKHLL